MHWGLGQRGEALRGGSSDRGCAPLQYDSCQEKVLQNVSSILTLDVDILQPILIHLKD